MKGRIERIKQAARPRRSALYWFMRENYVSIKNALDEAGRPNWTELSKVFGEEGLADADEKPPSPEGARQTWWKVRKTVEATRARRAVLNPEKPRPPPQIEDVKPLQPVRASGADSLLFDSDLDVAERVRAKIERLNKSLNR